jgi:hypothetical protein
MIRRTTDACRLAALDAPEPDMPPFDQSKCEPTPAVEINPKDEYWVDPTTWNNLVDEPMSETGLVSRVTPVHTALRNCTRDEGRSFEVGKSGVDLKPPQAAVVKSDGGERCGNVGT